MPIPVANLIPEMRLRFVGPNYNGDPEWLVCDEDAKNGTVVRVHRVLRDTVIVYPEEIPEKHVQCRIESWNIRRFVVVSEVRETLVREMDKINEEVKHYTDLTKDRKEQFNLRQMSEEEKVAAAKRVEIATKIANMRKQTGSDG